MRFKKKVEMKTPILLSFGKFDVQKIKIGKHVFHKYVF